jgi:hypothetical protein
MKARGVLLGGLVLLLLGVAWPYLIPESLLWDDARAVELSDASESLHETMHAHGHDHDDAHFAETDADDPPEVISAAKHYRDVQAGLDSAKFWTLSMPHYLRWTGVAICGLGVVVYMAARNR